MWLIYYFRPILNVNTVTRYAYKCIAYEKIEKLLRCLTEKICKHPSLCMIVLLTVFL